MKLQERQKLITLSKVKYKEKILKAGREKQQLRYNGIPIKLTADFSAETLQHRRVRQDKFKMIKGEKNTTKVSLHSKDLIHI